DGGPDHTTTVWIPFWPRSTTPNTFAAGPKRTASRLKLPEPPPLNCDFASRSRGDLLMGASSHGLAHSDVNRPTIDGECRLLQRLAEGRVGVAGARNVLGRGAEF